MEDRKASLVAVGVSSVAIGGFWMARPNVARAGLKVVEQRNLSLAGLGIDRDAAVMFRLAIPAAYRDRDRAVQYRIVDRRNRVFPLAPMNDPAFPDTLKLQRGYPHRAEAPRLVAVCGSEILGSVSVGDLPEPTYESLDPRPNPFVSLVLRDGWIDVRPRGRMPRNERWRIDLRRTEFGPVSGLWTVLPNRGFRSSPLGLSLPFAGESKSVEIDITRFRLEEHKRMVEVPGLRLHHHQGGIGISVDKSQKHTVPLGPVIASIEVPQQDTGPYRPDKGRLQLIGRALLSVDFGQPLTRPFPERRDPPSVTRTSIELLSPLPSSLGLDELRLGPASYRSDLKPGTPIKTGPFTARLRLTAWEPKPIGKFTAVVPVEIEPPAEKGPLLTVGRIAQGG